MTSIGSRALLSAGPLPYSGGDLNVRFAALALPGSTEQLQLGVYDPAGRRVALLADGAYESGSYQLTWDGRSGAGHRLASGVYFLRLTSPDRRRTIKLAIR
ncbi:MAG: FlgD immunoglobulin-like domain containing protein [Candidatus Eisenbacteria bacterium]